MSRITKRDHNYSDQLLAYAGVRIALPQDKDRLSGPFRIQAAANTSAQTTTISGAASAGEWDDDANLSTYMPTDGDFWLIVTGFESYFEGTVAESGEDLAIVDAGSYLSHTPKGGTEVRYHAAGSLHARGKANITTLEGTLENPGKPIVLPHPVVANIKDDTLTYVTPASSGLSEAKVIQLLLSGFAFKASVWSPQDSRFVLSGSRDSNQRDKLAFTRAMFQRWGGRGVRLFQSLFA